MPQDITPDGIPNPNPPQPDTPRVQSKAITCECCGSKLDRHGNLLRRGDLAKQMIDAEDTIDKLKKSIAKAEELNGQLRAEIDSLKAQVPQERKSIWSREA